MGNWELRGGVGNSINRRFAQGREGGSATERDARGGGRDRSNTGKTNQGKNG